MTNHTIVSREQWVTARRRLLAKEKEFLRLRDQLSSERRELPWERVDNQYVFEGPAGNETLADLFAGRSQLIVYHFMFAPEWETGCKSCYQRPAPAPPRSRARHLAGGHLRVGRGPAGQGGRARGEERERLRPVSPARRFARHHRAAGPGRAAGGAGARRVGVVRAGGTGPSTTGRRLHRPSPSCGTAPPRGCCSRAIRPTWPPRPPSCPPVGGGRGTAARCPPALAASLRPASCAGSRARSSPRSAWASCTPPTRRRPRPSTRAVAELNRRIKATFDPTGRLNPGRAVTWPGYEAARRRRRAGRVRGVRAVPAALPDLPRHRPGVGVAARPHRRHAGRARRRRRGRTRRSPRSWTCACSAGAARWPARRRCRSAG